MEVETRGKMFDKFISELPYMKYTIKKSKDEYVRIYEGGYILATVRAIRIDKCHKYEITILDKEEFCESEESK